MEKLDVKDRPRKSLNHTIWRTCGVVGLAVSTALAVTACETGGETGTNTTQIFEVPKDVATPYSGVIARIAFVGIPSGRTTVPIQVAYVGTHEVVSPDIMQAGSILAFDCLNTKFSDYDGVLRSIYDHNTGGYPNPEPAHGGGGAYGPGMVAVPGACFADDTLVDQKYLSR